jgi:hypothetical protein
MSGRLLEEMAMRRLEDRSKKRASRAADHQADLFRPVAARPMWSSLPPEVRRTVTELLARLLSGPAMRSPERFAASAARVGGEDADD